MNKPTYHIHGPKGKYLFTTHSHIKAMIWANLNCLVYDEDNQRVIHL